ncbi:uncharacterized protein ACNS7B_009867 [Menidia menidia]
MGTMEPAAWGEWCSSQLRIVLLGGRNSGKNSVGNLILGKEEFVTKERTSCSRRLGLVAGRWLTVVDTPGWWCDFRARDTPRLVKREILTGVSLCSPGPHVFLITVKASSAFSERRRRAVEEHVGLLGDGVWSHCMLVFTFTTGREHRRAEECVAGGGRALRWLAEKCGQRCHSVVCQDGAAATELLGKIQGVVAGNGNRAFEARDGVLVAAAEEKRGVEERAQLRFQRVRQNRSLMREGLKPVTDIRIVLLGAKGSGKSSSLNTILGREGGRAPGRTARCHAGEGVVFGRRVTVVDTPGWWMNYFCDESSLFDRREIVLGLSLCPPGPHVFLLVVRLDRAFAHTHRRAAREHLELISPHVWSRLVLLFTVGDWLGGTTTEQYIESEGEPLRWLVEKCGNRYHVLNNKTRGDGFQVRELIGKIEEIMTGGWHYEIHRKVLEELETGMKEETERARERQMKKEERRQRARSQLGKPNPPSLIRMILIGGKKVGKSSCGNTILGRKSFDTEAADTSGSEERATVAGRTVAVVDTAGRSPLTSDLQTTNSAVLIVVNVSSSFKEAQRAAVEEQLGSGGGRLWGRAAVLFSHGDLLGDASVERRIESEGEPLRGLVERCGNRYHVLDNKNWGDGAQVRELVELVEEMLVEEMLVPERTADLQGEDCLWKSVESARGKHSDTDLKEPTRSRHQLHHGLSKSASSMPNLSLSCPEDPDAAQAVAIPAERAGRRTGFPAVDRHVLLSCVASLLSGKQRPDLPAWFPAPQAHRLAPGRRAVLLVSCQTQHRGPPEREGSGRTLQRLSESEGMQAPIDQWGVRSLEELEAFIDSYFEMVWEQTMGSFQPPETARPAPEQDTKAEEKELLLSIDKKLSKLELLEEIKSNLAELRQNLESSRRAKELRDKSKTDSNTTVEPESQ